MGGKKNVIAKALSLRAGLMYRAYELAFTSHNCATTKNIASSKLLTRALFETTSVLGYLYYKIIAFIKDKDMESFHAVIMNMFLGSRYSTDSYTSINILTMIDKIDKKFPGYRDSYDLLSEYSHPNFLGTCGLYGELKGENPTEFNSIPIDNEKHKKEIIDTICLSLDMLKYFSIEIEDVIDNFVLTVVNENVESTDTH